MSELKQVFQTPDGRVFNSKAEADAHLRRPMILEALNGCTENNEELSEWLLDNQEAVESAFEVGTIRRVTKREAKQLSDALEYASTLEDSKLAFLADNADAIKESFRWPKVKRMSDEEKAVAAKNTLVAASDGNEELADWVIANKDKIFEAYDAGKVKREVSEKAKKALAAYREKMAKEKAAAAS